MRNDVEVLRRERSWSQEALAIRVGVSRQTVNAIEAGRFNPSLPLALRLARLFEKPVEAIFFDDDSSRVDP
ncbi:helix-turn-helix transcriptional regulator [Cryobacterium sp. W22_MBD10_FK3]|uniref:helix-turn-helix transcriptional regulator n=1 Tax=Cryobacterium sp. W22_MBD10_FK3 TaxID=3240273 RepID=UPI003F8D9E91